MSDILLIHGSCHGAWCWRDVIPALAALGHSARAIDLPSHGDDPTPVEQATLEGCRDAILAACRSETVVLGHSWGGYPISAAAEAEPDAMRGLIYLCAYVPISGLSMVDMRKRGPRQPLLPAIRRDPAGQWFDFDPEQVPALFYHDCPEEAVAYALPRLCRQPIRPQATPLRLSARFEAVPKHYILCAEDRAIPPEYQSEMTADWPCNRVSEMPTSHSPFFADPEGLAARIDRIATEM